MRRAARQILARPEFQPTPESPLARARRWLLDQLNHVLSTILGGGRTGIVGAVLAVTILVALVVVIVLVVRGATPDPVRPGVTVGRRARPPTEWLAEAAARESRGDWRGALRCRYRALVAELARRGLVDEIPGRTTGEYRGALSRSLPTAATDFVGATDLFERAWYGDLPTDAAADAEFRALADRVLERAR